MISGEGNTVVNHHTFSELHISPTLHLYHEHLTTIFLYTLYIIRLHSRKYNSGEKQAQNYREIKLYILFCDIYNFKSFLSTIRKEDRISITYLSLYDTINN